jgi:restriction system protein
MKLAMAKNSLFAILLRKPWWISIGIAAGIAIVARALLPEQYAIGGALGGIPFIVIGAIAGWRQLRAPSAARLTSTLEAIGGMSWREFSSVLEEALRRDGYVVTRLAGAQADFEIVKAGRTSLVSCKRWKAANTGVEPLRDLYLANERRGAQESIYVAVGGITDNARRFAAENRLRIVEGPGLAQMLSNVGRAKSLPRSGS